jgi:RhtB (resistance to homoserine/threonine) family protein
MTQLVFGEVFLVALAAGMSPGPDFLVVMRNGLGFGLRAGLATALGIAFALTVHVTYTIAGFAVVLAHYPAVFAAIRVLGACYLAYLGVQAVRARAGAAVEETGREHGRKTFGTGVRDGFLCNLLNPKAPLFFLAVFGQFLSAATPAWARWTYGLEVVLAVGGWFVALSFIVDRRWFRASYARWSVWVDRAFGVLLLTCAARILADL